ncbi:hypothetical protein MNEG_8259 [Monoraphidium neglectum]|uniref:F-box domain-containing protein n=1 Tax=Monoraphidium neglectum TaxID=145388 RepID=A0A0D2M8X4_9CHLO|nr:hypothetical protein MNEG_8259 [Monoraphidium neglectum]KIY99699.1 hypothetical protein MNEG_8259 [Monoraphidium neglectum]|eukprot:XP_013898719.1 hypothetical protein MNEG_8259 [Monoraphidium neglectum]
MMTSPCMTSCDIAGADPAAPLALALQHAPTTCAMCVRDLPDYLLEKILRLAFGGSLGRLTAAAPVCRRWRLLAHGTAEEASLRCDGSTTAAVLLLRRLAAGTSATAGGPNEPCLGTLEPPRLCLVRLVVAVKDAPWDAIRELLLALQIVDAATDSCVQFEYLELDLDTTESSTRIGVDADAVATLAPLGALRRLSSLSITSCTPALTGPLAAALAPRVTSLCLKWASIGATLEPVAALTNLRALSLGFRPLHIGADWLEPLLGLAGGLTSLELSATLNFLQGEDLQGALSIVGRLPLLRHLGVSGMNLVSLGPDGRPLVADLAPLAALSRLETVALRGGSCSIQRDATMREILRPVAALPALRTATLRLFARRWSFERDVPMDAATLRAWLAERGSRFRLKFPLEAP